MLKLKVKESQRVLLLKDCQVFKLLKPGAFTLWRPWKFETIVFDINEPEVITPLTDILIKDYPRMVSENFSVVDVQDNQVAIVRLDGKLYKIFKPGSKTLIWNILKKVSIEYIDISEDFEIPKHKVELFSKRLEGSDDIKTFVVPESHDGLLYVNGRLVKTVPPSNYAFFQGQNTIALFIMDKRKQNIEIQGQEILTKDRVSIRLNFEAVYKVIDAMKAVTSVKNYNDYLYKELQLALRKAVSHKTLDELLELKESLADDIRDYVKKNVESVGIRLESTGVKDIILPGDMRTILNKVVFAQKEAQANNIKRREEVAATRSLLNTAKLIENNPTLMKLKELESIERISEKIESLNVYGGIQDMVGQLYAAK